MAKQNNINYTYIYRTLWDGNVCRWKKSVLNVYINYEQVGQHLDKKQLEKRIKNASQTWEEALKGKIVFNFENVEPKKSDIYIDFQRNCFVSDIGVCQMQKNSTSEMTRAYITYGLIWTQYFDANLLHEFGHALGIAGHSPNQTDIMHGSLDLGYHGRKNLSQVDINTIQTLYKLPIGCDTEYIKQNIDKILRSDYEPECEKKFNTENCEEEFNTNETETKTIVESRNLKDELDNISTINLLKNSQADIRLSEKAKSYIIKIKNKG